MTEYRATLVHFENHPSWYFLCVPTAKYMHQWHQYPSDDFDTLFRFFVTLWNPFSSFQCKLVNFYLICMWSQMHTNILIVAEGEGVTNTHTHTEVLLSYIAPSFFAHDNSVSCRNHFIAGNREVGCKIYLNCIIYRGFSHVQRVYCQQSAVLIAGIPLWERNFMTHIRLLNLMKFTSKDDPPVFGGFLV